MEKEQLKEMTLIEYLGANPEETITKGEMLNIVNGITVAYDQKLKDAYEMIIGQSVSIEVLSNLLVTKGIASKEELVAQGKKLIKKDQAMMKKEMTKKSMKKGARK